MNKFSFIVLFVFILTSCKTGTDSSRNYDNTNPDRLYKLQLNPATGSVYHYDITNETETKVEVEDKKIKNISKTDVGISYGTSKDSAGNFLFTMLYDKIHLYTNNNDTETDLDAENAGTSSDDSEKLLGVLKASKIVSTVTPAGQTIAMTGYKELGDSIFAGLIADDPQEKELIKNKWEKTIGNSLIKKNLDQLFKIFPDSAVHLGDTWQLATKEDELNLTVKSIYKLKAINSEIALINATAKINSSDLSINMEGIGDVIANLQGQQEASYEMETKTGMLINCTIKTEIEGTIKVMGREIPLHINTSVKIKGKGIIK